MTVATDTEDPRAVLAAHGWQRSNKPNRYIPKPVQVWTRDDDHVLIFRGSADLSDATDCGPLDVDVLTAFAAIATQAETAEPDEPSVSEVPVRILVWKRDAGPLNEWSNWPITLAFDHPILRCFSSESPVQLLHHDRQFGDEHWHRPIGSGLWLWEGTATVVAGIVDDPDEICLRGEWRRLTAPELAVLGEGGDVFAAVIS